MKVSFFAACPIIIASSLALAQDTAPVMGKWSGNYTAGRNLITVRVVVDIQSVEGGKVSGKGSVHGGTTRGGASPCTGDFPVEGTFKDNTLRVRATEKFGAAGDCTFGLTGTVEGNKLLAKRGENEFVMTK